MLGKAIKFSLFSLLMFIRPFVNVILGLFSGLSLLVFLFCLLFKREEQQVMWSMLGMGLGATMLVWGYDALITFLAPDDFVLITEH